MNGITRFRKSFGVDGEDGFGSDLRDERKEEEKQDHIHGG